MSREADLVHCCRTPPTPPHPIHMKEISPQCTQWPSMQILTALSEAPPTSLGLFQAG